MHFDLLISFVFIFVSCHANFNSCRATPGIKSVPYYNAITNAAPAAAIKPPMPTFSPAAAPGALVEVAAGVADDVVDGLELVVLNVNFESAKCLLEMRGWVSVMNPKTQHTDKDPGGGL